MLAGLEELVGIWQAAMSRAQGGWREGITSQTTVCPKA